MLAFGRPPHEVLGLSPDAPLEAVEEAYLRLRAAVAPQTQETLDQDARAAAARRLQELDRAVAALRRRLG